MTSIGWLEDIHDPHNWYGSFLASQYAVFNSVPAAEWFEKCQITNSKEETILSFRVADQATLHGLLAKIRDLGLELLRIERK